MTRSRSEVGKTCTRCETWKPLGDFYRHPDGVLQRMNKCKECHKAATRENRAANIKYYREYDRARSKTPERLEFNRINSRRWREANPDKRRAQVKLGNALRDGRVSRPSACTHCGRAGKVEAHHCDYDRPLDVVWLCPPCHAGIHNVPRLEAKVDWRFA